MTVILIYDRNNIDNRIPEYARKNMDSTSVFMINGGQTQVRFVVVDLDSMYREVQKANYTLEEFINFLEFIHRDELLDTLNFNGGISPTSEASLQYTTSSFTFAAIDAYNKPDPQAAFIRKFVEIVGRYADFFEKTAFPPGKILEGDVKLIKDSAAKATQTLGVQDFPIEVTVAGIIPTGRVEDGTNSSDTFAGRASQIEFERINFGAGSDYVAMVVDRNIIIKGGKDNEVFFVIVLEGQELIIDGNKGNNQLTAVVLGGTLEYRNFDRRLTKIINLDGTVINRDQVSASSISPVESPFSPDSLTQNLSQNSPERSTQSVDDVLLPNSSMFGNNFFGNYTQQQFAQIDPITGQIDNFNNNHNSNDTLTLSSIPNYNLLNQPPIQKSNNEFYVDSMQNNHTNMSII